MKVDPAFMVQLIGKLKEGGVIFDGTPTGLHLYYDSSARTFLAFRLGKERRETSRISVEDPRFVEKLMAQCLHLLEYDDV